MGSTTFILVCAAEVIAVLLFIIGVLLIKNRKLRQLLAKLKDKTRELKNKVRELSSQPPAPLTPVEPAESYRDKLTQQLDITLSYHYDQGSRQDIALDLDPDAPVPRRTAALRNAFLIAEKEATSDATDKVNWDFLAARYQQLLDFNRDYPPEESELTPEAMLALTEELEQYKKRIKNLERFKTMYFELEERWNHCQEEASTHYSELKTLAAKTEKHDDFDAALERYQASYREIGALISDATDSAATVAQSTSPGEQTEEIARLKAVAADQHRIINKLQSELESSATQEEQITVITNMQSELKKQSRFLQESETCVQLMDNELTSANQELESLRSKLRELPSLRAALKDLEASAGTQEQIAASLKHENKRLSKKLKLALESPGAENQETITLRKELAALQANYNDLEERFLDLKMQS